MTEPCDLAAVEARRLIGTKALSPVELLASCRARIEVVNSRVNAFVTFCWDRAEMEAKAAERAVMAGEPLGPLHGLPLGVKDLAVTEGVRTTFASPQFADWVPEADERQVAVCRAAGAIVVGKTNTPEFGAGANTVNHVFGATGNPFDLDKTVAGSSGGSAAALATGMVPLATGSDMGGSLRNPAAYCGITGFRPSPGVIPSELRLHGYSPLGVNGPMARDAADTLLLHRVMAGFDTRDPLSIPDATSDGAPVDLSSLRVVISEDLGFAPVSNEIRETFRNAVGQFEGVFGRVERRDPDMTGADEAFEGARCLAFLAAHHDTYLNRREVLGPNLIANLEQAIAMSAADAARALKLQTEVYRRFLDFMADVDVLICPAMAVTPFPHRQLYVDEIDGVQLRTYFHWLALAYGLTLTTSPVACIPCGQDGHGMPFGIQIAGPRLQDVKTLRTAEALQAHLSTLPGLGRPVPDLATLGG
ncbi:MAG: amidase [Geminicoccaceae bacterium]|nr:amidase [Geminicoccaceae bacterium]